jgi:hypothetical protein
VQHQVHAFLLVALVQAQSVGELIQVVGPIRVRHRYFFGSARFQLPGELLEQEFLIKSLWSIFLFIRQLSKRARLGT